MRNSRKCVCMLWLSLLLFVVQGPSLVQAENPGPESFIESFAGTCVAYSANGRYSFKLAIFSYLPETNELQVGVFVENLKTGEGFGTMSQTLVSDLDPTPVFEEITRGYNSVPIIKFRCTASLCARNVAGAKADAVGHIIVPACSGKEKLASALKDLIETNGGVRSKY